MAYSKIAAAFAMDMSNICFDEVVNPWAITTVSQSDFKNRGSLKPSSLTVGQFQGTASDMTMSSSCPDWVGGGNKCFIWPKTYKPIWVRNSAQQGAPILDCPNDVQDGCLADTNNKNIMLSAAEITHPLAKSVCQLQLSGKFDGFQHGMDCAGAGTTICGSGTGTLVVNPCLRIDGSKRTAATQCKTSNKCSWTGPDQKNCLYDTPT